MKHKPLSVLVFFLIVFGVITIALAEVINFTDLAPGAVVENLSGVEFSSNISGYNLISSAKFDTLKGNVSLGVNDGGFEVFLPGDLVYLTLKSPVNYLAVIFVSSPNTPGAVFSIETTPKSATCAQHPVRVLPDGGEVFPVILYSNTAFSNATLKSSDGLYSYNLASIRYGNIGDIDNDGEVTLADAILILKLLCDINADDENILLGADINSDGRIGLEESIRIIQEISGLR